MFRNFFLAFISKLRPERNRRNTSNSRNRGYRRSTSNSRNGSKRRDISNDRSSSYSIGTPATARTEATLLTPAT